MSLQAEIFKSKGYKVPNYVLDADGKRVQIETREDEEQQIKYESIIGILVNAGYYRARIKGLSPFDVVVGGMTWCIDTSNIDMDVDLLFKDSLTIGQKISLTEKIVVVLPKLKCPYFIEPHQIQGLDFIHIHPVIEWLVQWSEENRKRKSDYLQSFAVNQFHKKYEFPQDKRSTALTLNAFQNIKLVQDKFHSSVSQTSAIPSDLLLKGGKSLDKYGLSTHTKGAGTVLKVDEGKQLTEDEICALIDTVKISTQISPRRKRVDKNKELKNKVEQLRLKKQLLEKELEEAKNESVQLAQENKEYEDQFNELSEEDKITVRKIQELIIEHTKMKQKERRFKEQCKNEIAELQSEIEEMEQQQNDSDLDDLQNQIELMENKLKVLRQELGQETRLLTARERNADQIPSRAELSQYQRRFIELYNQVAMKHKETKQYYTLFNTLNDKYQYLKKEYNILNSIQDSYNQVKSLPKGKHEFLKQFSDIVTGVQQTKLKVEQKRNEQRKNKESLNKKINNLQELKRQYIATLKYFSEECKKNENLLAKIQKNTPPSDSC